MSTTFCGSSRRMRARASLDPARSLRSRRRQFSPTPTGLVSPHHHRSSPLSMQMPPQPIAGGSRRLQRGYLGSEPSALSGLVSVAAMKEEISWMRRRRNRIGRTRSFVNHDDQPRIRTCKRGPEGYDPTIRCSLPYGTPCSESAWARRIRPRQTLYKDAGVHIHCNCTICISYHPTLYEYNGSVPLFIRWIIVTNLHICCIAGPACSGYRLEMGRGNLSGNVARSSYASNGLNLTNDQYSVRIDTTRSTYSVLCPVLSTRRCEQCCSAAAASSQEPARLVAF